METNAQAFGGGPGGLVGSVVADRYRLGRLLSTGGSTVIFDGEDLDSQRPVTIKILRPDLVVSAGFRERFETTMRKVASISHPNIAAVYDWGVTRLADVSTGFVVIERLSGGSLRDLYDRGRRLSPSQALALGLDVCRGLDHAHRRGFVHGELSPSKLVFGDDRRVRIVDFGLSGLLAEQVWVEPSSVPTHVARYASPEQALSLPIDGTTDVYALCLGLVEGVTGELPFAADSTVATLAARVGRLMPVSADFGALAAVFEKAGRPEAAERSTAAQFGRGLVQAAEKLPRPEPLPLLSSTLFETPPEQLRSPDDPTGGLSRPTGEVLVITADEPPAAVPPPMVVDPPAAVTPAAIPNIERREVDPSDVDDSQPDAADAGPADTQESLDLVILDVDDVVDVSDAEAEPTVPLDLMVLDVDDDLPDSDQAPTDQIPSDQVTTDVTVTADRSPTLALPASPSEPGRRRGIPLWIRIVVPVLIVMALAALVVVAVRLFSTPTYEVPGLAGLERAVALVEIDEFDWEVTVELARSDDEPRIDHVIRTVPGVGERLGRGEPFLLVVSEGPELRILPDLEGLSFVDAEAALAAIDLVPVIEEAHDEEVPRGGVIRWFVTDQPDVVAGDGVLPGTEVVVVASIGPAPRVVPDLGGLTTAQAAEALVGLRLGIAEIQPIFDDEMPIGRIVVQVPEPGTEVPRESVVQVAISLGPDLVVIPDLAGTDFAEAQRRLAEQGLIARLEFGASDGQFVSARVDGSTVSAGDVVRRGTQVDLVFL